MSSFRFKLKDLVEESKMGVAGVLVGINDCRKNKMSHQVFLNKLNAASDSDQFNLSQFERLIRRLGAELHLAEHWAEAVNAVVVELPVGDYDCDVSLLDASQNAASEFGKSCLQKNLALRDGRITNLEMKRIRHANRVLISAILEEEARYESMVS